MWPKISAIQSPSSATQSPSRADIDYGREWAKADGSSSRVNTKASVKGKKALARARALQHNPIDATGNSQSSSTNFQPVNHLTPKSTSINGSDDKSK